MSQAQVFLVHRHDEIMEGSSVVAVRTTRELAEQFIRDQGDVEEWRPYTNPEHAGRCILWARVRECPAITDEEVAEADGEMTRAELEELRTEHPSYSIDVHDLI